MSDIHQRTLFLKEAARRHGFMGAGISRAVYMEDEARKLEDWLGNGYHGEMAYMANHFDMRVDPTKLVPGAKTVVSLMYNYFPGTLNSLQDTSVLPVEINDTLISAQHSRIETTSADSIHTSKDSGLKISRYAYGEDYHKVVRRKLKALVSELQSEIGDFHARIFVDSAPVMERDWAKRSGQGWIGKNTLLIDPKKGSYFFLAEIILDVEFEYDHPIRDHCGTCTRCIEACPTDAISPEGYVLDGSKCISYLTIELKSSIPEEFNGKMEDWIFGCDICQEVCPWNRFASAHNEHAFNQTPMQENLNRQNWEEMTEEIFINLFDKTPLKRAGYQKMMQNIKSTLMQYEQGSGDPDSLDIKKSFIE